MKQTGVSWETKLYHFTRNLLVRSVCIFFCEIPSRCSPKSLALIIFGQPTDLRRVDFVTRPRLVACSRGKWKNLIQFVRFSSFDDFVDSFPDPWGLWTKRHWAGTRVKVRIDERDKQKFLERYPYWPEEIMYTNLMRQIWSSAWCSVSEELSRHPVRYIQWGICFGIWEPKSSIVN